MTEPKLDTTGMMLGEMKGQLRELIHNFNTTSMKIDGLTETVLGAKDLPEKIEARRTRFEA